MNTVHSILEGLVSINESSSLPKEYISSLNKRAKDTLTKNLKIDLSKSKFVKLSSFNNRVSAGVLLCFDLYSKLYYIFQMTKNYDGKTSVSYWNFTKSESPSVESCSRAFVSDCVRECIDRGGIVFYVEDSGDKDNKNNLSDLRSERVSSKQSNTFNEVTDGMKVLLTDLCKDFDKVNILTEFYKGRLYSVTGELKNARVDFDIVADGNSIKIDDISLRSNGSFEVKSVNDLDSYTKDIDMVKNILKGIESNKELKLSLYKLGKDNSNIWWK